MKKMMAFLLSLLMIFSLVSVSTVAADDKLVVAVANDLHYIEQTGNYTSADFAHIGSTGQLNLESVLIIKEFLKEVAADESDCVLLPGDLVHVGNKESFAGMAALLAEFERTSGKPVYVVPGNHEMYKGETVETFVSYFYAFGYDEAIARDPLSASYVVDLNDEYRLIAIDGATPGQSAIAMTSERVAWIEEQAKLAYQEGKKTIAMNHFNMIDHFLFRELLNKGSVVDSEFGLPEIFAKYDVKYTFCGHTHEQDISSYTGSNGNVIYDVVTGTLNSYPCPYRVVTFGDKVKIETRKITKLSEDTSFLQPMITPYCYELLNSDFTEYTEQCLDAGLDMVVKQYISSSKIKNLLGLDAEDAPELAAIIDELVPELKELVYLPLYEKDAAEPGMSIEAKAEAIGMSVLPVEAYNFADIITEFYKALIEGDESYGLLTSMFNVANTAVVVIIEELLDDVTGEQYTMVLDCFCKLLGADEYIGVFTKYTGDGIARLEGINYFVSSVFSVVLLQISTDRAPGDNNVTLCGYQKEVSQEPVELTFWEKVVKFFKDAFSYFLRILGF